MNRIYPGLALLALVLTIVGCAQEEAADTAASDATVTLETTEQRLSYGIAYGLGVRLKEDDVPLDLAAFAAGLQHAFEGQEQLLSEEQIGLEMQAYQQSRMEARQAAADAEASRNTEAGNSYRETNAGAEGVVTTESGLQYKVLTAAEGPTPAAEDTVEVHYRGTLIDGTEFDSSYSRGTPATFGLNQVIPGWTEGLQLMPVGSKYQFVIPPELAYGAGGAGGQIGPNATLIFEVELLSIPSQAAAAEEPAAPAEG